jgi:Tfp pilus assembly protein PilN
LKPVNLIPLEQRRGQSAPLRAGFASYAIVAALVVAVGAVTYLVLTQNKISEREAEVVSLQARKAETAARYEAVRPYSDFASVSQSRDETVNSLAKTRFDWERVLNELARVIPPDVWLVRVAGSVTPETQAGEGASVASRTSIPGPALELIGCGASTDAVARFLAALKDIDGVTRVGIDRTELPEPTADDGSSSVGSVDTASDECRTRDFISRFEIVAAFDAVPVPAAASPVPGTVVPEPVPTDSGEASVADAQAQEQQARDSTAEQTEKARNASSELIPGTIR